MKLTRRAWLYLALLALGALFLPRPRAILRQLLFSPEGEEVAPKAPSPTLFGRAGENPVSIVRGNDPEAMVKRAVDLLGGIERLDVRGRQILVKPNVVASQPPPSTTSPAVVAAVVKMLLEAGARRVQVGDMSAFLTLPTRKNIEATGIRRAVEEAGAEVIDFDDGPWVKVSPKEAQFAKSFFFARVALEAERLVSVPVIKTHRSATYSISLKNTIGLVHPRNRPSFYGSPQWEEIIAEVNLAAQPHLIIADGTQSMIAGGPWSGEAVPTRLVMASGNLVALDVAGLGLIKHFARWRMVGDISVWAQRQIRHAVEIGLGESGPETVRVVAEAMEGPDEDFEELVATIRRAITEGPPKKS